MWKTYWWHHDVGDLRADVLTTTCSGLLFLHSLLPQTLFCISEQEEIFLARMILETNYFFSVDKVMQPNCSSYTAWLDTNLCSSHQSKRQRTVLENIWLLRRWTLKLKEATTTPMVHLDKKDHVRRCQLENMARWRIIDYPGEFWVFRMSNIM